MQGLVVTAESEFFRGNALKVIAPGKAGELSSVKGNDIDLALLTLGLEMARLRVVRWRKGI